MQQQRQADVKLAIDTLLYHEPFSPADAEIPGGKDVFLLIRKIEGFLRDERDSFNDIFDDRDLEAIVNDIARRFKTAVIPQDIVFK